MMKTALTLLCGLALCACNGANGQGPDLSSQMISASSSQTTVPKTTVKVLNYTFGPYRLAAGSPAKAMVNKDGLLSFHVDAPVWMTGFEPHITDAKGNALPGKLVQQVILSNNREANPLCTAHQTGNPFAATTSLLQAVNLPEGFGYPLLPEDALEAKIVLRNPTSDDFNEVYFSFTLTAEPMDVANRKTDVAPLLLEADPCDHTSISLPPNGLVEKKGTFVAPEDGKLVKAQGLLQDYGVSVAVQAKKDDAKFDWSANSQMNDAHQIVSLDEYDNSKGTALKKDDPIAFGVVYDNFSDAWVNDATAGAMVYIARDSQITDTSAHPSSDNNRTGNQPTITATKGMSIILK